MAVLEARKLKKMDLGGASDPYVKIKLFDSKVNGLCQSLEPKEHFLINAVCKIPYRARGLERRKRRLLNPTT